MILLISVPVTVTWYVPCVVPAGTMTVNSSVTGVPGDDVTELEARVAVKALLASLGPAAES